VQTLHPLVVNGELAYDDGWRDGLWTGFCGGLVILCLGISERLTTGSLYSLPMDLG
jgi:hypothetical protein